MTWADFYLICFAVGFAFSLLSFVGGGVHWHLHFPSFSHGGATHLPAAQTASSAPPGGGKTIVRGHQLSPLNLISLAAFLAWFGGTGYLLTRFSSLWFLLGLSLATLSGVAGAAILFFFLSRVLISEDENLDPADFEMAGVLGRLSVPIRAGGTGEIVYSQAGTRRACGARSEEGKAFAKGEEVMVTRYEKGIAYVRLWSEMSGEEARSAETRESRTKGSAE